MADEKTYTKAELDAAIEAAVGPIKDKLSEVMDEAKDAKRKLRNATEIKPEDLAALESENDTLKADLAKAQKEAKDATKAAETATKALETEQGAARSFALEAELSSAIAEGNVVPSLVPAFRALMAGQAKADLVDGKYAVTIGEKAAREHIKSFLDSDDGKAFRAAPINGGGGAPGSGGGKGGGDNPFAKDTRNLTEQSRIMREDPTRARELASAAGISLPA